MTPPLPMGGAFPTDTPEHLACLALDLSGGQSLLALERLEMAFAVLRRWRTSDIWLGDVIPDDPPQDSRD